MSTRARYVSLSVIGALSLVASSASAQRRGPGPFAGTYSVTSNTTVNVTSPIQTSESRETHERAEVRTGSRADMAFHVTNDRGDRCVLEGNQSGESGVNFLAGQRCTMTDTVRNLRMNLSLRSGSGSISGGRLSLHLQWGVTTSMSMFEVTGNATQQTSGNRTSGGPAEVAPAPQPSPMVVQAPVAQIGAPQVAPLMGVGAPATASRTRRGRRGAEPVVIAAPVAPAPAPLPAASPVIEAPIWGIDSNGAPVAVPVAPMPINSVPVTPAAPVAPAAPPANAPAPLWGAASPAPGFGAPAAPVAAAWGAPARPAAQTGGPLVQFGGMQGGATPTATAPAPYGYPQPAAAPYGYPQAATPPYGYPQAQPYGYPQAQPYGYPQAQPQVGAAPLVQFGTQQRAPGSAAPTAPWATQPSAGARPLVTFSVTTRAY